METKKSKNILVVNDDGIAAPGIKALLNALLVYSKSPETKYSFRIVCVAPAAEQSAKSHSISVHEPIKAKKYMFNEEALKEIEGIAVFGTPADCTRVGLFPNVLIGNFKPDMVLSGINKGNNAGINIIYSGTVAGAVEATILGYQAIAFSLDHPSTYPSPEDAWPYDYSAKLAIPIIEEALERGIPKGITLNVNFPNIEPPAVLRGVKVSRQGDSTFEESLKVVDIKDEVYSLFVQGVIRVSDSDDNFDTISLKNGWVTVTPLLLYTDAYRQPTDFDLYSWKSCNQVNKL